MSLSKLPAEIIARVIGYTDPADVRRCTQVSRLFHTLVKSQAYLEYMLELDMSGYTLPSTPRTDISYIEKAAILRERREKQQTDKLVGSFFIPFPEEPTPQTQYVDGTVMFGFNDSPFDASVRYVIFHQLPSRNQGTEYKHWKHDLGFSARRILIHPDLDLLVAVEHIHDATAALPVCARFEVHLLTMSTCEPHPGVEASDTTGSESRFTLDIDGTFFMRDIWLYDHLLAVELGGREIGAPSCFVVWDWVLGKELAHTKTKTFRRQAFGFVSEEFFVVLCNAQPDYSGRGGDGLSHFEVYHIDSANPSTRLSPSQPIAKLALPTLHETQDHVVTELMSTGVLSTASSRRPRYPPPVPRVYELPSDGHILCLDIRIIARSGDGDEIRDRGCLFVASTRLLDILNHHMEDSGRSGNSPCPLLVIPWESWCSCTRYISFPLDFQALYWVSGPLWATSIGLDITILDFSSRRWKDQNVQEDWAFKEEECIPPGTARVEGNHDVRHRARGFLEQSFDGEDNTGHYPRYTRRALLAHEFDFHQNMMVRMNGEQVGVVLMDEYWSPGGTNWDGIWMYEI